MLQAWACYAAESHCRCQACAGVIQDTARHWNSEACLCVSAHSVHRDAHMSVNCIEKGKTSSSVLYSRDLKLLNFKQKGFSPDHKRFV